MKKEEKKSKTENVLHGTNKNHKNKVRMQINIFSPKN